MRLRAYQSDANCVEIVNSVETMHKNHPLPSLRKFVEEKKKFRILNSEGQLANGGLMIACLPYKPASETGLVGSGYFFQFIILNFSILFASHLLIFLRSDDDCDTRIGSHPKQSQRTFQAKECEPLFMILF